MGKLTRKEVEQIINNAWKKGTRPDFQKTDLSETDLSDTDLRGTDLSQANLNNANLERASLFDAKLKQAKMNGVNLNGAVLTGAILRDAWLKNASLKEAKLTKAILDPAYLMNADMTGADLSGADLSIADLDGANLNDVNLTGANLKKAHMGRNKLGNTALISITGLETVRHSGPSSIGLDTLERAKGKIPEVFLRGCGLSDLQIEMAKLHNPDLTSEQIMTITYKIHELLIDRAIHYHSCFISYSSQDEAFAQRLHADLQQKGVRCWFAPEDMKIGDKIRPTIDQSIRVHDKLLLVLSENSVASQWVEQEVETALERERKQDEKVLFPVRLDEAVMKIKSGWPALIRNTCHVGDFSRWKDHGAYQQAFERLLRDLKAEG